jgi:6-phosphogluconate dehydrogenase
MVHNGIEYAIMQLISEVYDILKRGVGLNNDELHEVFKNWNEGDMQSFLLEITADIFTHKDADTGQSMVDVILDKAGAKELENGPRRTRWILRYQYQQSMLL